MYDELFDRLEDMGAEVDDTLDRLMGDEDMYAEMLHRLPDNENIIELRKACDLGDSDRAMREVHTLKGIALNLGLLPLVDECMDMLLDFREGKPEDGLSKIDNVEECFKEWSDAVKA